MSEFVPNTYQKPNHYTDQYMHLLTGDEWKILDYAIRRIMGFHRQQRRISLTQFCCGTTSDDNRQLDYGTGIGREAAVKVLKTLCSYRLLTKVAEDAITDPRANEKNEQGQCYELQLNSSLVDHQGLIKRHQETAAANAKRTNTARQKKAAKTQNLAPIKNQMVCVTDHPLVSGTDQLMVSETDHLPVCETDHLPVCETDRYQSVRQTSPLYKDRKPEENQKENQNVVVTRRMRATADASETTRELTTTTTDLSSQNSYLSNDPSGPKPIRMPKDLDESARPFLEAFLEATNWRVQWEMGFSTRKDLAIVHLIKTRMATGNKPEDFKTFMKNFPRFIGREDDEKVEAPTLNQWLDHFDAVLNCPPRKSPTSRFGRRSTLPETESSKSLAEQAREVRRLQNQARQH